MSASEDKKVVKRTDLIWKICANCKNVGWIGEQEDIDMLDQWFKEKNVREKKRKV